MYYMYFYHEQYTHLKSNLPVDQAARFHGRQCDVSIEQEVIDSFQWIEQTLGGCDVLVNNAGIVRRTNITDSGNSSDLRAVLETNVLGVAWCTREAFRSLQQRHVNDGHVVLINSIAGHSVPMVNGLSFNMYAPSKHAITAMTEVLRQEFLKKDTKIKVTSISPGVVNTEIFDESSVEVATGMPMLQPEDIANAISYCIQTPPNVQIHELTIKPVGEIF
ncbi:farnesol dehydrogenase [Drosophila tropicalis]|uniref:farnesol dehydrogenase n=1 Tax=Drosophila tropicalis TaxID=46794 RepID=UPI0035AB8E9C